MRRVAVIAASSALQALRDKRASPARPEGPHQWRLGVSATFAVQIAKSFGAESYGRLQHPEIWTWSVPRRRLRHRLHAAGFTTRGQRYDLLVDCVAIIRLSASGRGPVPRGTFVGIGGSTDAWGFVPLAGMLTTLRLAPFISQKIADFWRN